MLIFITFHSSSVIIASEFNAKINKITITDSQSLSLSLSHACLVLSYINGYLVCFLDVLVWFGLSI